MTTAAGRGGGGSRLIYEMAHCSLRERAFCQRGHEFANPASKGPGERSWGGKNAGLRGQGPRGRRDRPGTRGHRAREPAAGPHGEAGCREPFPPGAASQWEPVAFGVDSEDEVNSSGQQCFLSQPAKQARSSRAVFLNSTCGASERRASEREGEGCCWGLHHSENSGHVYYRQLENDELRS